MAARRPFRIRGSWMRRIAAVALLTLYLGAWIGVSAAWTGLVAPLAAAQLIPALLAGAWGIVLAVFLLTLLFGRIYCSVLCPLGLMQDAISRLTSGWIRRKKKPGFTPAHTRIRWIFLLLCIAGLLDPYSIFGRISTLLLRPAANAARGADFMGQVTGGGWMTVAFGWAPFLMVGIMAAGWGRLYCNTICPVGTMLGVCSKRAVVRIRLDACTQCGRCDRMCKAHCIDSRAGTLDASRCVMCFNCLDACKRGCMSFRGSDRKSAAPEMDIPSIPASTPEGAP